MWLLACTLPDPELRTSTGSAAPDTGWPAFDDWETPISLVIDGQQFADQQTLDIPTAPAGMDQPITLAALLTNRTDSTLTFSTHAADWLQSATWSLDSTPPASLAPDQTATLSLSFNPATTPTATTQAATLTIPDQSFTATLNAQVPRPLRTVIVGDGGWWATSDDYGQTWQTAPTPAGISSRARTVVWGEGRFFRADASSFDWTSVGLYAWSEDGQTWQSATATDDFWPSDCAYGNELFSCLRGGVLSWSDTGGAVIHEPTDYTDLLNAMVFVGDHFIGVGRQGRRMWSDDGKTWLGSTAFSGADEYYSLARSGDTLVAVGGSNRYLLSTSLDAGATWQDQVWAESQYACLYSVAEANGTFLAQGQSNYDPHMWRSTDGINWESIAGLGTWESYYLLGSVNRWFLGTYNSTLYRSLDGETWESVLIPPTGVTIRAIASEEYP
jgi:hypothetical protein